jgi:hypothetical protein
VKRRSLSFLEALSGLSYDFRDFHDAERRSDAKVVRTHRLNGMLNKEEINRIPEVHPKETYK